jgi:two-component system, NarL family, sensor histidine kinase DesK
MLGALFASVWLVYTVYPLITTLTGSVPLWEKAALVSGLLVFAGLYALHWFQLCTTRWALLTYVLLAAIAVTMTLTAGSLGWGALFVYVAAAGAFSLSWRRAVVMVVVTGLLVGVTGWFGTHSLGEAATFMLPTVLTGFAMIGLGGTIRANRELRMAREEIARLAVSEERLRFARDLHDLLGHSLSVIVLKAELANKMAERAPERTASEVRDIERVARDALREVRDAVAGYRQPSLSHELESARVTLEAAGVEVCTNLGAGPLPTSLETTLAWAVREGVTNVIRHSGARRVEIALAPADSRVELSILDDGMGGEATAGSGLRGIAERLAARGGELRFGPRRGGGFELRASLPLRVTPDREAAPA